MGLVGKLIFRTFVFFIEADRVCVPVFTRREIRFYTSAPHQGCRFFVKLYFLSVSPIAKIKTIANLCLKVIYHGCPNFDPGKGIGLL